MTEPTFSNRLVVSAPSLRLSDRRIALAIPRGGIVTLTNNRRGKASSLSSSCRSSSLTPRLHGRGSKDSVRAGGGEMALNVEGVVGGRVE